MFIEKPINKSNAGWIEVITGSMFSGKTEELIRRLKRAQIAKQKILIFKHGIDNRYSEEDVVSHDFHSMPCKPVKNAAEILCFIEQIEVVGIDEAQFFDHQLVDVCNILANKGIRVIVTGLDIDFKAKPFGPMPQLLSIAEFVTKLHAICQLCGDLAHYSYRKIDENNQIVLGEKNIYDPLCRSCFNKKSGK